MSFIPEFLKAFLPLVLPKEIYPEIISYSDTIIVPKVADLDFLNVNQVTRPITHIVVHHTGTADGAVLDTPKIRAYHMAYRVDSVGMVKEEYEGLQAKYLGDGKQHNFELPDVDIAYNVLIEKVGVTYIVCAGRSLVIPGAHTKQMNMNRCSVGVCFIGNYDVTALEPEAWDLGLKLVRQIQDIFGVINKNVLGHREVYDLAGIPRQKTCPGTLFDMDRFRANLAGK